MRSNLLKKIVACAIATCCALSLFFISNVSAASNIFEVINAELTELSETAEGNLSVTDDENIESNIAFKKVGDQAKIKITLKNVDEKDHIIKSVTDNNQNSHISYNYNSYENVRVNSGETFVFIVTAKYQNAVESVNDRTQTSSIKFSINFVDVEKPDDVHIIVPDTGEIVAPPEESVVQNYTITAIVLIVGVVIFAILTRKHKNIAKIIVVLAALVAIPTVMATTETVAETSSIQISFNFVLDVDLSNLDVVEYDIASDAVKNYYAHVSSWSVDESTFLTAMKNNYDSNSCKATTINPQTSNDFPKKYRYSNRGTIACDKPKGYDTEVSGDIKVYLLDGTEATYVSSNDGIMTNLIPGTTYYWKSTADESVHGYVKATGVRRLIDLPTARNVRDLGGIKAAGGKTIQYGRIMRGEKLDDNDVFALNDLDINKEYDVRSEDNGSHFDSGYEKHAMMNYDIIDDENYDGARDALTSLMNDIIAGNNVYIHCSHGSDRTGTLVYLAEALLGVSDEDRDRDFDITALSGRPDRTRFYDHMSQSSPGFNPERKYVYMKNELPNEAAVRTWYLRGSSNSTADEQLIENFKNAILK